MVACSLSGDTALPACWGPQTASWYSRGETDDTTGYSQEGQGGPAQNLACHQGRGWVPQLTGKRPLEHPTGLCPLPQEVADALSRPPNTMTPPGHCFPPSPCGHQTPSPCLSPPIPAPARPWPSLLTRWNHTPGFLQSPPLPTLHPSHSPGVVWWPCTLATQSQDPHPLLRAWPRSLIGRTRRGCPGEVPSLSRVQYHVPIPCTGCGLPGTLNQLLGAGGGEGPNGAE